MARVSTVDDLVWKGAQFIRFVGGPYHGRTLAAGGNRVRAAVLKQKMNFYASDMTMADPFIPLPVDEVGYERVWLERQGPTFHVREQVMLLDSINPYSTEAQQRWQELRPL